MTTQVSSAFRVLILNAEKTVFDGAAVSLIVPGEDGYMGFLKNHPPLITTLVPGRILIRADARTTPAQVDWPGKGFMEFFNNSAVIILHA